MSRFTFLTGLLAAVTVASGSVAATTAATAASAAAVPPNVTTELVSEQKTPQGWNMPTRLVLRNNSVVTVWVYAPLNGYAHGTTEFKVAELAPGQEFTISGSNSGTRHYDVYLRLHLVDKHTNTGEPIKGRMIGAVFATNPGIGAPYVGAASGLYMDGTRETAYRDHRPLDEHETHTAFKVPETLFHAWIHRDADHDGHKVLKMTIDRLDLRRSIDVR